MFVWGIIGYIAGIFSKQLHNDKYFLYGYSIVCGIGYSLIMDLWSVLHIITITVTGLKLGITIKIIREITVKAIIIVRIIISLSNVCLGNNWVYSRYI